MQNKYPRMGGLADYNRSGCRFERRAPFPNSKNVVPVVVNIFVNRSEAQQNVDNVEETIIIDGSDDDETYQNQTKKCVPPKLSAARPPKQSSNFLHVEKATMIDGSESDEEETREWHQNNSKKCVPPKLSAAGPPKQSSNFLQVGSKLGDFIVQSIKSGSAKDPIPNTRNAPVSAIKTLVNIRPKMTPTDQELQPKRTPSSKVLVDNIRRKFQKRTLPVKKPALLVVKPAQLIKKPALVVEKPQQTSSRPGYHLDAQSNTGRIKSRKQAFSSLPPYSDKSECPEIHYVDVQLDEDHDSDDTDNNDREQHTPNINYIPQIEYVKFEAEEVVENDELSTMADISHRTSSMNNSNTNENEEDDSNTISQICDINVEDHITCSVVPNNARLNKHHQIRSKKPEQYHDRSAKGTRRKQSLISRKDVHISLTENKRVVRARDKLNYRPCPRLSTLRKPWHSVDMG